MCDSFFVSRRQPPKSSRPKAARPPRSGAPARKQADRQGGRRQAPGRRALSAARQGGRIVSGGDRDLARALGRAFEAAAAPGELHESVTHPIHTYAARLHPATARDLVALVLEPVSVSKPALLDPFCGAGTVLVEARLAGARPIGVDINPLAVAIARAKTWDVPASRRAQLLARGKEIAAAALAEGKAARRSGYEPPTLRAPRGIDPDERDRALEGWFSPHVRRELEFLAGAIDGVREEDRGLAAVLEVLLSSILYKVSKRAADTDPSTTQRRVARGAAARLFRQRVEMLAVGLEEICEVPAAGVPRVVRGDARDLARAKLEEGSVHAVVTSPPYAGTYDYLDQHGLRLAFLGWSERELSAREIGARRSFRGDRDRAMAKFGQDLGRALAEIGRVLVPGGLAAIVIGDSLAGNQAVYADELVRRLTAPPLRVVAWASQSRPTRGAAEVRAFADRPKREHILLLQRA
jgi:DNA modification methylase